MAMLATLSMVVFLFPGTASAATPDWDLRGTYTIHYYLGGAGDSYDHSDTITVTDAALASNPYDFTGTGKYVEAPGYAETVTGSLNGSAITFQVVYTGANPGYTVNAVGSIASDGSMSGTATGPGQTFTWTATGKARPFGYTSSCGAGETFISSKNATPVSLATTPGHAYKIDVYGTYYAGGSGLYDIQADAEFSQDRYQFANGLGWTALVHGYESGTGTGLLDLSINGANVAWGSYSATHDYTTQYVAPVASTTVGLRIDDMVNDVTSAYSNNTGGLCVKMTDLGSVGTFFGFFSPINNGLDVKNVAKAGSTIPVKWQALDYFGNPITDPSHFEKVVSNAAGGTCTGDPGDAIEEYSGGSGLQYLGDGYWQFNWKTPKTYAGQCRLMTLNLDGPDYQAEFLFK